MNGGHSMGVAPVLSGVAPVNIRPAQVYYVLEAEEQRLMSMMTCPECGHDVSDRALTCPACGYPLAEDPVIAYTQRRIAFGQKASYGLLIVAAVFALLGFVDRGFLPLAFGATFVGVAGILRNEVARAQLDKSKLKR